jgi:hypothetical protein
MYVPPSAQIRFWREQDPEKRDRDAIRVFAHDLGLKLKQYCLLFDAAYLRCNRSIVLLSERTMLEDPGLQVAERYK